MVGIKLQLLCGVRIELAVESLPYLALARPFPYHVLREEGVLQTRQSLGLEAEPHQARIWGPFKQTNKQNKSYATRAKNTAVLTLIMMSSEKINV